MNAQKAIFWIRHATSRDRLQLIWRQTATASHKHQCCEHGLNTTLNTQNALAWLRNATSCDRLQLL
jgi:hypothetical protein